MKDFLRKNGLDGQLQADVLGALRVGRAKQRAICLVGDATCGKSFLFKGLARVLHLQEAGQREPPIRSAAGHGPLPRACR